MGTSATDTADVRLAMLEALGDPPPPRCDGLALRIKCASDAQHLWHLRGDLMLALMRGEVWAGEQLARITSLFEAGLPRGLASCVNRSHLTGFH